MKVKQKEMSMMSDLPEPRGRGASMIDVAEQTWACIKLGIVLGVWVSLPAYIAGLAWGFLSRSF